MGERHRPDRRRTARRRTPRFALNCATFALAGAIAFPAEAQDAAAVVPPGAAAADASPGGDPAPATAAPASVDRNAGPDSNGASLPATGQAARASSNPAAGAADIVVTGSRVISNGNNSPTPVTVVTTAQLQQSTPSNIPDALNKLPVFAGSRSQASTNNASANAVGNFLNLRGVGAIRTLILFDGHRVVSTAQDGTVDTNTIPQILLQRVDVVTGGASAVYGSDAVTGVVNFIVDKKFEGLKLQGQGGLSQRGDDGSLRFGVAWGTGLLGGRGHFEASYEHYSSEGIPSKLGRKLGPTIYAEEGGGSRANPFHLIPYARNSTTSFTGLFDTSRFTAAQLAALGGRNAFAADGSLTVFSHGLSSGTTGIEIGGDGAYTTQSSLAASLRTDQAFARFDYDLTDAISAYAQVSATSAFNRYDVTNFLITKLVIAANDPFLPAATRAAFAGAGVNSLTYSRTFTDVPPNGAQTSSTNYFANGGVTGKLFAGIAFDAAFAHSRSTQTTTNINNINSARLAASLDAVSSGGRIVCNVTLTNPGLYPGCVPLNPIGPASDAAAAIGYARNDTRYRLTNQMDDATLNFTGSPFSTWAGPVRVALSGEYRRITLDNVSTAQPTAHPDCTGLRFNCSASTVLYLANVVADAHGRESITEGAFEANIPLLRDFVLARSLDLNGAVRYARYSVSGNATTWKVGLDWHVTDDLTLRGTRSQDIRAPTLNDLFAPVNASQTGFTDLHTNSTNFLSNQSQGNPNLVPEVAQTLTLGGVYRPHFVPRLSVAVDYFRIRINDAIATVGGNSTTTQQLCEASGGTSSLCALYVRPLPFSDRSPANFPTLIVSQGLNVATVKTWGIDGEVNYSAPVAGGNLSLRGLVSYQPQLVTVSLPGATPVNAAGAAGTNPQPSIRMTGFVGYTHGPITVTVQERWRNALKQNGDPTIFYSDPKVPAVAYTDLSGSYLFRAGGHKAELFFAIQNLLDKDPPVFFPTTYSGAPGLFYPVARGDDVIGRYFTAGVRFSF